MRWYVAINPWNCYLNPSWTDFCRAGRSYLRIFFTRTSNLTSMTFLWTLFYWKVCLGSAWEQKIKIKMQYTSWFSCILLPLELTFFSSLQLITASLSWAFQQQGDPPKYQYQDPVTSELLLCDQCPPGTAVKSHCSADAPTECQACPEKHFAENWHWGDTCQFCTSVRINPSVQQFCFFFSERMHGYTGKPKVWDSFPSYV